MTIAQKPPGAQEGSIVALTPSRRNLTVRERYAASAREPDALKAFVDLALIYGGWYAHLKGDQKGQRIAGQPDVLMILPAQDGTTFTVWYEVKIGSDSLTVEQRRVLEMLALAPGVVSGVVRFGKMKEGEIDLDEALSRIRRAMQCERGVAAPERAEGGTNEPC